MRVIFFIVEILMLFGIGLLIVLVIIASIYFLYASKILIFDF